MFVAKLRQTNNANTVIFKPSVCFILLIISWILYLNRYTHSFIVGYISVKTIVQFSSESVFSPLIDFTKNTIRGKKPLSLLTTKHTIIKTLDNGKILVPS